VFKHSLSHSAPRFVILHWYLMAFLAGSVNVGGFLACNRFVTHMTGFATLFGMHAEEMRWDAALGIISVPAFFLLGVMVSAWLVDRPARRGSEPRYSTVMVLVALCLLVAALLGHFHFFGTFGEEVRLKRDYFFLALLCAASGLQNSAITTASAATVRATHLTGPTTDLGIGIVRALSARPTAEGREEAAAQWRLVRIRFGQWAAFASGSAAGAVAYMRYGYLGFLLPMALALYLAANEAISPRRRPSASAR
jgi:uncharacterized membrane protein YoaK (UPF0700 family)